MMPAVAAVLHMQMDVIGTARIAFVPLPSLRINAASVMVTIVDLVFLAIAWEYLGKPNLKGYWNQIEAYIMDHSEAEFSHGICNDCARIHYPELDLYGQ
jgi:hypothetical protein